MKLNKTIQRLQSRLAESTPEQLATLGVNLGPGETPARFIEIDPHHGITVGLTPSRFYVRTGRTTLDVVDGRVTQRGRPVSNADYLIQLGLVLLDELIPG